MTMKLKVWITGFLMIYSILISAQNTFPTGSGSNVGIGTTSPSTRLQVTSATAGTSGLRLTNLTSSATATMGNGKAMSVDANGNVVLVPILNTQSVIYVSSYSLIDIAISLLNSSTTIKTLIIDKNSTLLTNQTINSDKNIVFLNGNVITLSGNNLTINGVIEAGAFQIFNCNGTGNVIGNPKIEQALPQWWQNASSSNWTNSIQKAVDFYPRVYFPKGDYNLDNSIFLNENSSHFLYGEVRNSKFICSNNNYAFRIKVINTYNLGLVFENLSFYCLNGIQFNDNVTELNDETGDYILNTKITGCYFDSPSPNSGIAIQLHKVFDSEISNNRIDNFRIGINLRGSDINTISKNRISYFNKYGILDEGFSNSSSQLGSQNSIYNNDILAYNGNQDEGSFIKTSSHHVLIKDNYLENGSNIRVRSFIDCSNFGLDNSGSDLKATPKHIDLRGNRLDLGNTSQYTYLIQEEFSSLFIDNNKTTHPLKAPPSKFISSTGYLFSDFLKSRFNAIGEKEIHIMSCESFGEWNNFNSLSTFSNTTNGGLIIDSRNVSSSIKVVNNEDSNIYFNPLKFKIQASSDKINLIDLKQGLPNGQNELFKRIKIRITLKSSSSTQTGNLYMRADSTIEGLTTNDSNPYYQILTVNNDYFIIEYSPSIDYVTELSITTSDLNLYVKSIELVPIIETSLNKTTKENETKAEEVINRLTKLEEQLSLINLELKLLKESNNNDENTEKIGISIYPNPMDHLLKIKFTEINNDLFVFSLYDSTGKVLLSKSFSNKSLNYELNIQDYPEGSYVYKIESNSYIKTGIIIKK